MIAKLWPGLSLAIIALLLFLWLKSGCKSSPTVDATQTAMTAIKAGYDSAKAQDTPIIHRLNVKSDSIGQVLAAERKLRQTTETNLQARAADLRHTLAALDQARQNQDTAGRIRQGDSLEKQIVSGIPAVEGFTHLTDSMINSCEAEVAIKDSIIFFKDKLLKAADTTITSQQLQYAIIHKDDAKKTAQLKFYRPAAIGGISVVAIAILIKLASH